MRSRTRRFAHLAPVDDEMSYEPPTACTPGIVLVAPTASDVPTYSFSTNPCKHCSLACQTVLTTVDPR